MTTDSRAAGFGWRLGAGIGVIVVGYAALMLIPTVSGSELPRGLKSLITGVILLSPLLSKVAAVAIMGKSGFTFIKQRIFGFVWGFRPTDAVSPKRYRLGLGLMTFSFIFGELLPYLPGALIEWNSNPIFWSLVADLLLIISLFLLGGGFWDKLRALFTYDANAVFAEKK